MCGRLRPTPTLRGMTWEWRGIGHDDVAAWNALIAEAEAVDRTEQHYNEADLHEELDNPETGPDDRAAAWVGDRMVAFAGILPRDMTSDTWRIAAEGVVDPRYRGRGLGSEGLSWLDSRVLRLRQERGAPSTVAVKAQVSGHLDNAAQVELLEGAGYGAVNWSAIMRVQLSGGGSVEPSLASALPAGYRLHGYASAWSERTRSAHNAAFTDHWGFTAWSRDSWKQWEDDSRNARHEMSWVAEHHDAPDDVAGYVMTHEYDAHQQATGRREAYLAKLGVRREYRGRGLATALLRIALERYAEAGYDESSLDVDTNNPTGAFELYERVGYVIESRTATFEKVFPPAGAAGS